MWHWLIQLSRSSCQKTSVCAHILRVQASLRLVFGSHLILFVWWIFCLGHTTWVVHGQKSKLQNKKLQEYVSYSIFITYLYEMKITKSITIHKKVKKNAIYYDKTQHANFRRKPPFQPTKQHLNGEKRDVGYLSAFGSAVLLCCGFFVCFVFV